MRTTTGYLATTPDAPMQRVVVQRRDLRPDDVAVRVTHCGVCHSDLHAIRAQPLDGSGAPLVPGHEMVGEVVAVGAEVTAHRVGDAVAIGNIVDSCGTCRSCRAGQENFCTQFPTLTYGGTDRVDGTTTLGAWSGEYVAREAFVHRFPAGLDPAGVAPLLCAGVTVWEPLRAWAVGPGTRLGVVGLGGLGHLAVRLGRALGATVTVFTTSAAKTDDARALGAEHVVVSSDEAAMARASGTLDLVLDCVAVPHDLPPYLRVLDLDGTLCLLGDLGTASVPVMDLLVGRKRLASSGSGGRARTQELLDFCGAHGIVADVEVLPSAQVDTALARLAAGDVRYRFALDLADLAEPV